MKEQVKKLYQSIKNYRQLADEIDEYAIERETESLKVSEYWDDAGQAASNIVEAIDILKDITEGGV